MSGMLTKFFRFGIVGGVGMLLDFFITWLCKEQFHINKFIANTIGFVCAIICNYTLNRVWTFRSTSEHILQQFLLFFLTGLFGLLINTLIIYILTEKHQYNFYLSKAVAIAIVFVWNFAINNLLTFQL